MLRDSERERERGGGARTAAFSNTTKITGILFLRCNTENPWDPHCLTVALKYLSTPLTLRLCLLLPLPMSSCLVRADPFGHSASQGSLFTAGAGFSAMFIGRLDMEERAARIAANATVSVSSSYTFIYFSLVDLTSYFQQRSLTIASDSYK